jgi:hypothetical protein
VCAGGRSERNCGRNRTCDIAPICMAQRYPFSLHTLGSYGINIDFSNVTVAPFGPTDFHYHV